MSLYALVKDDGNLFPAGFDYCLPYHNLAIKIHHRTILSNAVSNLFHAIGQGVMYKNSMCLILNFYMHTPKPAEMSQTGVSLIYGFVVSTAPCPKHVFLKYFSIKAELLVADITADSGSKFCIGNI